MSSERKDREAIRRLVAAYFEKHKQPPPFVPSETPVPCGGRVFDAKEMQALVDAALDFWLTAGPRAEEFEAKLARRIGVPAAYFVGSGSSALLLAVTALCDRSLGARRLVPGDEVITPAMAFPTTVAPIVMAGAVPVFVDVELPFYNPSAEAIAAAVTKKSRAIVVAHGLGNPFDAAGICAVAEAHGLWLVEDACDALGSTFQGRPAGSFGDLAALSFYASHHMTTGEGGAVLARSEELGRIVRSLRDWGRDCVCLPGQDNACGERFTRRFGTLPPGFDHKYVCGRLGFNLKATDLQAAIGLAQLAKLDRFTAARKRNFARLARGLAGLEESLILPEPAPGSDPSWFGFPITLRDEAKVARNAVVAFLEECKIATRMLLAGNLARHPGFEQVHYRTAGPLATSDRITARSFWVGVHPGLTAKMCAFTARSIRAALDGR